MKRTLTAISAFSLIMLMFVLSACDGEIASPTTTDSQTETTTTTTTASAEMTQTHNRSVCVGILNIGSCNTAQVNTQTQTVHKVPGVPAPTQDSGMTGAGMVGTLLLLCVTFVVVMGFAAMAIGSGGYNR